MQKGILFTVLNWGLGHASRSIPIIHSLLAKGHNITIASDGAALKMLQLEFPDFSFIELPGYNARYSKKKSSFNKRILMQIPHFLKTIEAERKLVHQIENQFDLVISDNRYGCFFRNKKSIYIGHQLNILFPDSKLVETIVNKVHHSKLKNFDELWIPDSSELNISGKLSAGFENKSSFIGLCSRMKYKQVEAKYDVCVLLSGPEPQRSLLERELIQLLTPSNLNVLFIRGLINPSEQIEQNEFEVHNSIFGEELNQKINQSKMVICRSGYSSIMDLIALNKKGLLIPTPGQSEQEYLAQHLQKKELFSIRDQENLHLEQVLEVIALVQPKYKELGKLKKNLI